MAVPPLGSLQKLSMPRRPLGLTLPCKLPSFLLFWNSPWRPGCCQWDLPRTLQGGSRRWYPLAGTLLMVLDIWGLWYLLSGPSLPPSRSPRPRVRCRSPRERTGLATFSSCRGAEKRSVFVCTISGFPLSVDMLTPSRSTCDTHDIISYKKYELILSLINLLTNKKAYIFIYF